MASYAYHGVSQSEKLRFIDDLQPQAIGNGADFNPQWKSAPTNGTTNNGSEIKPKIVWVHIISTLFLIGALVYVAVRAKESISLPIYAFTTFQPKLIYSDMRVETIAIGYVVFALFIEVLTFRSLLRSDETDGKCCEYIAMIDNGTNYLRWFLHAIVLPILVLQVALCVGILDAHLLTCLCTLVATHSFLASILDYADKGVSGEGLRVKQVVKPGAKSYKWLWPILCFIPWAAAWGSILCYTAHGRHTDGLVEIETFAVAMFSITFGLSTLIGIYQVATVFKLFRWHEYDRLQEIVYTILFNVMIVAQALTIVAGIHDDHKLGLLRQASVGT